MRKGEKTLVDDLTFRLAKRAHEGEEEEISDELVRELMHDLKSEGEAVFVHADNMSETEFEKEINADVSLVVEEHEVLEEHILQKEIEEDLKKIVTEVEKEPIHFSDELLSDLEDEGV